jgi:hypothetical protein
MDRAAYRRGDQSRVARYRFYDDILAGASAIGAGGELLPKDALRLHQEYRIHELARRFLKMVKEARAQRDADLG